MGAANGAGAGVNVGRGWRAGTQADRGWDRPAALRPGSTYRPGLFLLPRPELAH